MGAWVMSVVGVICLGLLLEIVLPDGQTAKYAKGAFSLLVVFVIAAPLPKLLDKGLSMNFDGSMFGVDESFQDSAYASFSRNMESSAEKRLAENGYLAKVKLVLTEKTPRSIDRVDVTVTNFINVASEVEGEVRKLIADKLRCEENKIFVVVDAKFPPGDVTV